MCKTINAVAQTEFNLGLRAAKQGEARIAPVQGVNGFLAKYWLQGYDNQVAITAQNTAENADWHEKQCNH